MKMTVTVKETRREREARIDDTSAVPDEPTDHAPRCKPSVLEWYWKPQTDRSDNEPFRPVQTAERVVVKYLDRKARASTANRRSHSDVGGARRGVREYGAVNYHKVELKEQAKQVSLAE